MLGKFPKKWREREKGKKKKKKKKGRIVGSDQSLVLAREQLMSTSRSWTDRLVLSVVRQWQPAGEAQCWAHRWIEAECEDKMIMHAGR
jgi:hypothetical protein